MYIHTLIKLNVQIKSSKHTQQYTSHTVCSILHSKTITSSCKVIILKTMSE